MFERIRHAIVPLLVALLAVVGLATIAPAPMASAAVSRPVVSTMTPTGGLVTGGTRVTIRGRAFTSRTIVRFGSARARVLSHTSTRLIVKSPAAPSGAVRVSVTTVGKTARTRPTYVYRVPAARISSRLTPVTGTYVAASVDWVSGGPSIDNDPSATPDTPYVVSLPAGSATPDTGQPFLVRPGNTAYPIGLAGTVESVGFQADGTLRVTVTPTALQDTLSSLSSVAIGPVSSLATPAAPPTARTAARAASGLSLGNFGAGVFDCRDIRHPGHESPVSFTGGVEMKMSQLNKGATFDSGGLWRSPSVDTWVTGAITISGTLGVDVAGAKCSLKQDWVNAHRAIVWLPAGFSLSIAPQLSLTIGVTGKIHFEQTTHYYYDVSKSGNNPPVKVSSARSDAPKVTGDVSLEVTAKAGLAIRFGYLDRIGVELGAGLQIKGSAQLKVNPTRFCASVELALVVDFSLYFDAWVKEWTVTLASSTIDLKKWDACTPPLNGPDPDATPQITSSSLPDARVGDAYDAQLAVLNDPAGVWSFAAGDLPPGLSLSSDGLVTGTPTSGVGTWRPTVRFTSSDTGKSSTAQLSVRVLPDAGLGGGQIQATLTWSGATDLDLHGFEPDGNEIYYNNRGPSANGGELDHDANAGCGEIDPAPAENIRWDSAALEAGDYGFEVITWSACGIDAPQWHLVVRVDGVIQIDQTGTGDSSYYSVTLSSTTTARSTAEASPRPARRTSKVAG